MLTGSWEVSFTFTSLVLSVALRDLLCTVSDNKELPSWIWILVLYNN